MQISYHDGEHFNSVRPGCWDLVSYFWYHHNNPQTAKQEHRKGPTKSLCHKTFYTFSWVCYRLNRGWFLCPNVSHHPTRKGICQQSNSYLLEDDVFPKKKRHQSQPLKRSHCLLQGLLSTGEKPTGGSLGTWRARWSISPWRSWRATVRRWRACWSRSCWQHNDQVFLYG